MQAQKMVTAEAMARAVQFDPQFVMPVRPSFPKEFVVVPLINGLLAEGTDISQVLRGQATKTLLPRLIPLLDGTRTIEQLAEVLKDVAVSHIQQAIALLYTRGLLEDKAADPEIDAEQFDSNLLAFFRRHVDTTRVNRSALEAAARLHNSEVVVYTIGDNTQQASIVERLRNAGIGSVTLGDWGSDLKLSNRYDKKLVVALVEGEDDIAKLTALDNQCARLGISWLRVAVQPEALTADLGPYFEREETACYQCFRLVEADSYPSKVRQSDVSSEPQTKLWASMLVTEVIYLLSRIGPIATGPHTRRYDLSDWSVQTLRYPRLPGCPNCRPVSGLEKITVDTAIVFEDAVRFPSRHLNDPKNHQVHYHASNLDLAKDSKRYPNVEKVSLPAQTQLIELPGTTQESLPNSKLSRSASSEFNLDALASLLLLSAGVWTKDIPSAVKPLSPKRWAATGGNLGSVELYVAACNVAGLEPGLYFYQVHEHQLARISKEWSREDVEDFIRQAVTGVSDESPDALIVSVAALHRVSQKYGSFAYRVTNLDAGFALAQLQMVGNGLGLQTQIAHLWADDVISDRLDLLEMAEPVTGAVLINGARNSREEN
ncbi:MAG TPA: SagB family peptide dehydrogenase [Blastocatellia bacterium]|nr:SagB family peptide dehydrogenase [Blastocatellia bacterium]